MAVRPDCFASLAMTGGTYCGALLQALIAFDKFFKLRQLPLLQI
jgi:hypothetical protein